MSPSTPGWMASTSLTRHLVRILAWCAGIVFVAICIGLAVRGVPNARAETYRTLIKVTLFQSRLGLRLYMDERHELPPARYVSSKTPHPHSWRTLVLKTEGNADGPKVLSTYDFEKPWNSPQNIELARSIDHQHSNLFVINWGTLPQGISQTCAVIGEPGMWDRDRPRTVEYVKSHPERILLAVNPWTDCQLLEPRDVTPAELDELPFGTVQFWLSMELAELPTGRRFPAEIQIAVDPNSPPGVQSRMTPVSVQGCHV